MRYFSVHLCIFSVLYRYFEIENLKITRSTLVLRLIGLNNLEIRTIRRYTYLSLIIAVFYYPLKAQL